MKELPSKVIIIGAGPSGLFAARRLNEIAQEQGKTIEIVFLEREKVVGGKCHTYKDPKHPELRTEWGAGAVAPNYGVVIDALEEHNISFEKMITVADNTIEIKQLFNSLSFLDKIPFINAIRREINHFNRDYDIYKTAVNNKAPLPDILKIPFSEYCAKKGMKYLPIAVKPFVPGFGYGAVTRCPAYSVLEYLGKTTLPEILLVENFTCKPSLLAIHGGFQVLMEKMAAGYDVRLNAKVTGVTREPNKVTVRFQHQGKDCVETADTLFLATSPKNWEDLGLDMTEVEKQCVQNVEFYRYPVAVYKIKGLPPHQYYFPKALEEQGFGHVALITSRDNRPTPSDGRLCTIYINLPPGNNNFQFDHAAIEQELRTIPGVTQVTCVAEKIWEDYMSTLDWDLRRALAKEPTNTQYLGSYALGGFEDVACVASVAYSAMSQTYAATVKNEESFSNNWGRFNHFFHSKVYKPIEELDKSVDGEFLDCQDESELALNR